MSRVFSKKVLESIISFAENNFGSQQGLALAMGVRPQNLNAYLTGKRNFGQKYIQKLENLGFSFDEPCDNTNNTNEVDNTNNTQTSTSVAPLDLEGLVKATGTDPRRLETLIAKRPGTLSAWAAGTQAPTVEDLATLLNLSIALTLSRLAALEAAISRNTQQSQTQDKATG